MARFNTGKKLAQKTVNLAGGDAFVESPQLALVSLLLTSFANDQFYRSADQTLSDLTSLVDAVPDKKFVGKAAIYARTKFGMRSITHAVAGELASRIGGQEWAKDFFDKIVYRPDDMMEILSYIYAKNGKESNAIRKGFAKAFSRFDEYQLAKYKGEGKDVSLVDVANIVHPAHSTILKKLIEGKLRVPKTWETQLTQAGQKAETEEEKDVLKAKAWKDLVEKKTIGYFALLRNLRNILEQAPELVKKATAMLVDKKLIKSSLVLPFRYLTAIDEIEHINGNGTKDVLAAISEAMDIATNNVPEFPGTTLVALDVSGSMSGRPREIGSLFAALMFKKNNADLMLFDNEATYVTLNPKDTTLTLGKIIHSEFRGGGTDFHSIFHEANRVYDRIIILSDMQAWVNGGEPTTSFAEYRKRLGADPKIYSFDLQGYGTLQFPERNVFTIAGFSEKIFDVMKLLEQDRDALIHEIEKIEL